MVVLNLIYGHEIWITSCPEADDVFPFKPVVSGEKGEIISDRFRLPIKERMCGSNFADFFPDRLPVIA